MRTFAPSKPPMVKVAPPMTLEMMALSLRMVTEAMEVLEARVACCEEEPPELAKLCSKCKRSLTGTCETAYERCNWYTAST